MLALHDVNVRRNARIRGVELTVKEEHLRGTQTNSDCQRHALRLPAG
jgi:hypothetical protein